MRKLFFIILTIIGSLTSVKSISLNDEQLNYKVTYKWGLINSQAGRATLSLSNNGDQYNALMVARTEPWADRIFPIRDTLISHMRITDLSPIRYDKIAHENGDFSHDIVKYTLNGEEITKTVDLTGEADWVMGHVYTYTLTIKATTNEILFGCTVDNWTPAASNPGADI